MKPFGMMEKIPLLTLLNDTFIKEEPSTSKKQAVINLIKKKIEKGRQKTY